MVPITAPPTLRSKVLMSRMKDSFVDAGVRSCEFGNCRIRMPKTMAMMSCRASFARALRPRFRPMTSLM